MNKIRIRAYSDLYMIWLRGAEPFKSVSDWSNINRAGKEASNKQNSFLSHCIKILARQTP